MLLVLEVSVRNSVTFVQEAYAGRILAIAPKSVSYELLGGTDIRSVSPCCYIGVPRPSTDPGDKLHHARISQ